MEANQILGMVIIVASYFVGCISPATLIGKIHGVDIRKEGSGNPGTTNVLRVLGKKQAAVTLVADVLKGGICVLAGSFVSPDVSYAAGAMALIGHCWPFEFGFRGGKGVATGVGLLLFVKPVLAVTLLIVFIAVVAVTRYVSLGSIVAALAMPGLALLMVPDFFWYGVILAVIVVFKHRPNISRLVKGEESKLNLGGKNK